MANGVKVKLNLATFTEIRNSSSVQNLCLEHALRVQDSAQSFGGTYVADVQPGQKRCHALVKTADGHAMGANAKYNALAKSLR